MSVAVPRTVKCLVVDDHVAVRKGVRTVLECEPNLRVVGEAADGDAAVALAGSRKPDVVVMDMHMPGKDGLTAMREILDASPDVGVIVFTGFSEENFLRDALAAGAKGYLVKDSPPDQIVRAVNVVAEGAAYVDPVLGSSVIRSGLADTPAVLSERETEILSLFAAGKRNDEIASELFLSEATVRTHVRNAMRKLEADTRTHAVAIALRQKLI
jgi:DNA-binding NarL/FixJ family response regulator